MQRNTNNFNQLDNKYSTSANYLFQHKEICLNNTKKEPMPLIGIDSASNVYN